MTPAPEITQEAAQKMLEVLKGTRLIVADGAVEGFRPSVGDWAERLFRNNASISAAIALAEGRAP